MHIPERTPMKSDTWLRVCIIEELASNLRAQLAIINPSPFLFLTYFFFDIFICISLWRKLYHFTVQMKFYVWFPKQNLLFFFFWKYFCQAECRFCKHCCLIIRIGQNLCLLQCVEILIFLVGECPLPPPGRTCFMWVIP